MNIEKKDLNTLPLLTIPVDTHNNGGNLYIANEKPIYKTFRDLYAFQEEIERNITFQINHPIPNTPRIYDKLFKEETFFGYSMEYIQNAKTFRKAINSHIHPEAKQKACQNIYTALKFLHQNSIFLGDIHLDNFLITPTGDGYITDLDYMRFPGDEYKFPQCYLICPNSGTNKINIASKYTDNIKVMISCLSLWLGIDLEQYIDPNTHAINIEELYYQVILPLNQPDLNEYFRRIQNQEEVDYFSDYMSNLHSPVLVKRK